MDVGSRDREGEAETLMPDSRGGRWLRRHLAAGVTVVTTLHGSVYRGVTVGAAMVASVDPFQILVSIEADSQMEEWLLQSRVFACSLLPWKEQFLADQFAGFTPLASGTFDRIPHLVRATGAPILKASMAWADCRLEADFETGDHRCFLGSVVDVGRGESADDDPLLYFLNRYRRLL